MSLPIVTLVGRPNVGKSTLFNRIIGQRASIVHDRPGVTRDRKYRQTEWAGRHFIVVDTGGYLPDSDDQIEQAIFEQLIGAMEESDLIILLVDAKTGLTALDEEIARTLKKSGRNVLLAINKADNEKREMESAEFFRLGLGEPVSISAISGRKVGDFLDTVISRFPEQNVAPESTSPYISLAVIGRPNVGKSSFVNAILGEERQIVTETPGTTRDANDTVFKYYGQEFLIIDTAGLRRKSKVKESIEFYSTVRSLQSIQRCDIAILIIEAASGLESQDMRILHEAIGFKKGVIIAANKWDLIEKDSSTAKQYEEKIRDSLKKLTYVPILFVSALNKQRIFKVIEMSKTVDAERKKTVKTPELNNFLARVIRKYPPPSMDRREVKINYCTQVKTSPPVLAFFCNAPKSIRPNYRAYLENQLRKEYGFLGVPLTLIFKKK
ncbi:MAG: ribosome biogenesis GTPase Der [bacterium]